MCTLITGAFFLLALWAPLRHSLLLEGGGAWPCRRQSTLGGQRDSGEKGQREEGCPVGPLILKNAWMSPFAIESMTRGVEEILLSALWSSAYAARVSLHDVS